MRKRPKELGCRRMRSMVAIKKPSEEVNVVGQATGEDVVVVPEIYADINGSGGTDAKHFNRMASTLTHRVLMRYVQGITQDMHLVVKYSNVAEPGDVLNIEKIIRRSDAPGWLELHCRQAT